MRIWPSIFLPAFALFVLVSSGCASHRVSTYSINGNEVLLGWSPQKNLPSDGYYVVIQGDKDGENWTVQEVYNHPIKGRSNESQEILFVDRQFRYVQPFFEYAPSTVVKVSEDRQVVMREDGIDIRKKQHFIDRGSWECGYVMKDHEDTYSPCTSRLTKTDVGKSIGKNLFAAALTLGVASGTHKVVDKEKLADILTKTNLFEQIRQRNQHAEVSGQ